MPLQCTKSHDEQRMETALAGIRESQASAWRHACAACAYERGVEYGRESARLEYERERQRAKPEE